MRILWCFAATRKNVQEEEEKKKEKLGFFLLVGQSIPAELVDSQDDGIIDTSEINES